MILLANINCENVLGHLSVVNGHWLPAGNLQAGEVVPCGAQRAIDEGQWTGYKVKKLLKTLNPASPDFSGWNCKAHTFAFSIPAEKVWPYSVTAQASGVTGP
jgi:hypothetical protein